MEKNKSTIRNKESRDIHSEFSYHRVTWKEASNEILSVRHKVFIVERHFEENVLCDIEDKNCIHLVARNKERRVIACARLNPNGRISKIAVLMPYRGEGVGTRILRELVNIGKQNNFKLV
ncbi:MAG: GNAT family N-acetyltransferase, partial [Kangiellaceae bacterium]